MQKYEQYVVIGHFAYKVLKESIRLYNIDYIIICLLCSRMLYVCASRHSEKKMTSANYDAHMFVWGSKKKQSSFKHILHQI